MVSAHLSQAGAHGEWYQANYFLVSVDGRIVPSSAFNTSGWPPILRSQRVITVPLASGLDASSSHVIRVFKSTEAQYNQIHVRPNFVTLHALEGGPAMRLAPPPPLPSRRLEFLGDSITCGYCNLCPPPSALPPTGGPVRGAEREGGREGGWLSQPDGPQLESFERSWANLVCEGLGAQCHTAAWSGFGLVENCCGGATLARDIWRRTLATVGNADDPGDPHGTVPGNEWRFAAWVPDAVVINLGTNDGLDRRHRRHLVPRYNATFLTLVEEAAKQYGARTHFFLACGPMSTAYCDAALWVIGQAAARGIRAHFLDQRGFLSGKFGPACCGHPSAEVDAAMARSAAGFIQSVLGW